MNISLLFGVFSEDSLIVALRYAEDRVATTSWLLSDEIVSANQLLVEHVRLLPKPLAASGTGLSCR